MSVCVNMCVERSGKGRGKGRGRGGAGSLQQVNLPAESGGGGVVRKHAEESHIAGRKEQKCIYKISIHVDLSAPQTTPTLHLIKLPHPSHHATPN